MGRRLGSPRSRLRLATMRLESVCADAPNGQPYAPWEDAMGGGHGWPKGLDLELDGWARDPATRDDDTLEDQRDGLGRQREAPEGGPTNGASFCLLPGRDSGLGLAVLPGKHLVELLEADQPKPPEHHRQRRLLRLGLAQTEGQGPLTEGQMVPQEPQQRRRWHRLGGGADDHGARLATAQQRRKSGSPSVITARLMRRSGAARRSRARAGRRSSRASGWRLENRRTSRSVLVRISSRSGQRRRP
jgi:hypothetical protein